MNTQAFYQSGHDFRDEQYRAISHLADHRLLEWDEERETFLALERDLLEWIERVATLTDEQARPFDALTEEEWGALKRALGCDGNRSKVRSFTSMVRKNFPCINALRKLTSSISSNDVSRLMSKVNYLIEYLVTHNQRLVIKVAKEHNFLGLPMVDLVQEGNIGLLKAIEKYDVNREHKFSTYAWWWIRHSITLYIRKQGGLVRKPDNLVEQMLKILREFDHSEEYQNREKLRTVAHRQNLPVQKVERLLQLAKPDISIDAPLSVEEEDLSLSSLLTAEGSEMESIVITKHVLSKYLTQLPESHRMAITLRFGLNDTDPQSFREIGMVLGRSAERCRQMTQEALDALKALMTR